MDRSHRTDIYCPAISLPIWKHKSTFMQNRLCTLLLFFGITLCVQAQELHFVKDVNPLSTGIEILDVAYADDYFFFVVKNPGDGTPELWRTDGTTGGTIMLQENLSELSAFTGDYISEAFNNIVYYQATDVDVGRRELWRTDGTTAGTYLLYDLEEQSLRPSGFTELAGSVYFGGRFVDTSGNTENALYKIDQIAEEIDVVSVLPDCPVGSHYAIEQAVTFNGAIYWYYLFGGCVYRSDGTPGGTGIYYGEDLMDIAALFPANNRLYFVGSDPDFTRLLYRTDGTPNGVVAFPDDESPHNLFAALDNKLVYTAQNPETNSTNDIWVANDEDTTAMLLYDFYTEEEGAWIENLVTYNDKVFFTASEYDEDPSTGIVTGTGTELWGTDGTTAGTYLVKDINQGQFSSNISNIVIHDGFMYFLAKYNQHYALFQSDGTSEGTIPYFDLPNEALMAAQPVDLYYHNNSFYLTMGDAFTGRELWRISLPLVNATEEKYKMPAAPVLVPNPFHKTARIQFDRPVPQNVQVRVINQNGMVMGIGYEIEGNHIYLDRSNLPDGFYYYQILINGNPIYKGKMVIN